MQIPEQGVEQIKPEHLVPGRLNVVVFGPGEGEGVVVALPDGRIGIVDGCAEADEHGRGDPVGELVNALMAKPTKPQIAFACMTHPHEDHIRGFGRTIMRHIDRVERAWFVSLVQRRNFEAIMPWLRHVAGAEAPDAPANCAERAYRAINEVLELRQPPITDMKTLVPMMPAQQVMGSEFEVVAWGPADDDRSNCQAELLSWLERRRLKSEEPPAFDPNLTSGAILLRWGDTRVLLAGDLLRSGWGDLRRSISVPKVQVVNVAHHASEEAHDNDLWCDMSPTIAVVTPFKHADQTSKRYPPTPEDVRRLLKSGSRVAITSPPRWVGTKGTPRPSRTLGPTRTAGMKTPTASKRGITAASSNAKRNAVAVTLDATGTIEGVVFGGAASWYT